MVTKQLGKTLTSLAESPDKRGQNKLFKGPLRDATKTKSAHAMNPPLKNDLGWDAGKQNLPVSYCSLRISQCFSLSLKTPRESTV